MPQSHDRLYPYINSKYVDAYSKNTLDQFTHKNPYPFAFLNDFWQPTFYQKLAAFTPSLDQYYRSNPHEYETLIYYEPFDLEEFVRLAYSKVFRRFLAALVGKYEAVRPDDAYPQLRTIKSTDGGLMIHNDANAPYNGVVFLNLNGNWAPGHGGELVIWEQIDECRYRKCYECAPVGNSLAVMLFSEKSFHSVNRANGEWLRTNILMEMDFSEQVSHC